MSENSSRKKRLISLALALILCLSLLPAAAYAEKSFPTTLDAPGNVIVSESTDKNYKYIYVTFNKSAAQSAMIDGGSATADRYGVDKSFLGYFIQIDWSIDSTNDWKYVANWDELKTHTGDHHRHRQQPVQPPRHDGRRRGGELCERDPRTGPCDRRAHGGKSWVTAPAAKHASMDVFHRHPHDARGPSPPTAAERTE